MTRSRLEFEQKTLFECYSATGPLFDLKSVYILICLLSSERSFLSGVIFFCYRKMCYLRFVKFVCKKLKKWTKDCDQKTVLHSENVLRIILSGFCFAWSLSVYVNAKKVCLIDFFCCCLAACFVYFCVRVFFLGS